MLIVVLCGVPCIVIVMHSGVMVILVVGASLKCVLSVSVHPLAERSIMRRIHRLIRIKRSVGLMRLVIVGSMLDRMGRNVFTIVVLLCVVIVSAMELALIMMLLKTMVDFRLWVVVRFLMMVRIMCMVFSRVGVSVVNHMLRSMVSFALKTVSIFIRCLLEYFLLPDAESFFVLLIFLSMRSWLLLRWHHCFSSLRFHRCSCCSNRLLLKDRVGLLLNILFSAIWSRSAI